jgi:arginine decarboxylase
METILHAINYLCIVQSYREFLELSVEWPQEGFEVIDDELHFHGINLIELAETYGTPLRVTYLPIIGKKIQQARLYFQDAFLRNDYRGKYHYAYCTKSSHFRHILEEVLKHDVHIETSSAYDMEIVEALEKRGLISKKNTMIICNGYKTPAYQRRIVDLLHDGFENLIPVLDTKREVNYYLSELEVPAKVGIRVAIEEKPDFPVYTSRLGIRADDVVDLYLGKIKSSSNLELVMLHFFVGSGIRDTPYYWNELEKMIQLYVELKKEAPTLRYFNIGGGMPFRNSLDFEFDYQYVIGEIVRRLKVACQQHGVEEPDIVSEFGSYTVAESGAVLFKVVERKRQNDKESWLILDGSLMTILPDIWALGQRYIILPLNNWDAEYERVILGGITCDEQDYYYRDAHTNVLFLPKTRKEMYIGFFHTGAYQESLSGVGGIHHCLIPTPRHILIRRERDGQAHVDILYEEQNSKQVLKILGYL